MVRIGGVTSMKNSLLLRALVASALLVGVLPASADENFPLPPQPQWWGDTGLKDIRYGQWLPCRSEWNISDDCLQGIKVYTLDGKLIGPLTYNFPEGFDPKTSVQEWAISDSPDGKKVENVAFFKDRSQSFALWTLPDGLSNTDGSKEVNADLHLMLSSLQLNLTSQNMDTGSLPEGVYFEYTIKSARFGKEIKWVLSNVRDPQIRLDGDLILVKGLPDNSASAHANDPVCEPNQLRARTTRRNMAVNMVYFEPGNRTEALRPDDVILGTNGWWCLSDFHFDSKLQQIIVKVGNVHFDEFGNEIQGWMELKVKGSRARKWWGMDPAIAAGYAKVEITYQDGTSKVATVSSNYEAKNDWINLRAYGFTYSTPQLAVSFAKPVKAAAKKSVICLSAKRINGKTKKITVAGSKCPAGYAKN
jgi:hypothetical protein